MKIKIITTLEISLVDDLPDFASGDPGEARMRASALEAVQNALKSVHDNQGFSRPADMISTIKVKECRLVEEGAPVRIAVHIIRSSNRDSDSLEVFLQLPGKNALDSISAEDPGRTLEATLVGIMGGALDPDRARVRGATLSEEQSGMLQAALAKMLTPRESVDSDKISRILDLAVNANLWRLDPPSTKEEEDGFASGDFEYRGHLDAWDTCFGELTMETLVVEVPE